MAAVFPAARYSSFVPSLFFSFLGFLGNLALDLFPLCGREGEDAPHGVLESRCLFGWWLR